MSDENMAGVATLDFEARSVTGGRCLKVSVQPTTPAGAVAAAVADSLALPRNIPWSLRDSRSRALDDRAPIGEQIGPNERVAVFPRTHLG